MNRDDWVRLRDRGDAPDPPPSPFPTYTVNGRGPASPDPAIASVRVAVPFIRRTLHQLRAIRGACANAAIGTGPGSGEAAKATCKRIADGIDAYLAGLFDDET